MLSRVQLLATPWTVACQAPLSMGFSRQEYWSGLPFPSPGDLPDSGIEPKSPVSPVRQMMLSHQRNPHSFLSSNNMPLYGWTRFVSIHSFTDGYLCFFYFLAMVNYSAVNIHVQAFVWTFLLNSFKVCINLEFLISLYKLLFYLDLLSSSIIPLKFVPESRT